MLTIFGLLTIHDRFVPQSIIRPLAGSEQPGYAIFTPSRRGADRSARQTGFSLIELMISITIGLIILLAVGIIFSHVSTGFRSMDDSSRTMENGNFALRVLGEDLRMVGFAGMAADPAGIVPAQVYAVGNNCNADASWPFPPQPSVEYIPPASVATLSSCIPAGSIVANSPAIVVRHATGMVTPVADLVGDNRFFIQSGPATGLVFQGKDYATVVKGADRQYSVCANAACTAAQDAPIFGYGVSVYYLRPCSRESGATCNDVSDTGSTLVRLQLSNDAAPSFVERPIAEGVDRLLVAFFDGAGLLLTTDLTTAVTARISILMRTRMEKGSDDSPNTYTLADGVTTFNCVTDLVSCEFRRYLYSDTVVLKNLDIRSVTYGITP